ncbi:MAG: hypothetical protein FJ090_01985 [Deltaproteobacteria bacterium]|nr:hypothetical protein [Deltaproteobacteria bacterium]
MTKLVPRLALASILVYAPAALAQDEGGDDDRKVVYKQKTEIDFEGLDVSGELVKPQSALVLDRKKAQFNPLIKLRYDFNSEMEQSIDEVK